MNIDGTTNHYQYNAQGQITQSNQAGQVSTIDYDPLGRIKQITDPLGQILNYQYDASGQIIGMSDGKQAQIDLTRDTEGNLTAANLLVDGKVEQQTEFETLDATSKQDILASIQAIAEGDQGNSARPDIAISPYQKLGALLNQTPKFVQAQIEQTDSQGLITTYTADDFGNVISVDSPTTGISTYQYNPNRLLIGSQSPLNAQTYQRDSIGRITAITVSATDGSTEQHRIAWGKHNKPVSVTYPTEQETFSYNENAQLLTHTQQVDDQSFTLTYSYDDQGRVQSKKLPDGNVINYTYNGDNKNKVGVLSGIHLKGIWDKPIITGLNSDSDTSLVQRFNFGNGVANTLQKDKNGRIVLAGNPKVGQTTLNYDPNQKQSEPEQVTQTHSGQMGEVINPQTGISQQVRTVLDQVLYDQNPEPLLVAQNDIIEQISQTPEMDQWGRTIKQGDQHYQYDSQNRLIKITSTDETGRLIPVADYRYNTFNQRIGKTTYNNQGSTTKTTYYFYDGNQLIAETIDTATQKANNLKQYIWLNDTPIAILEQGDLYYIHTDHRNAPIAVTDSISKLVWQADNEDFGYANIHAKSSFELNLRLSNQYYDSESGLHYNTNRYYDALNQQYLTPDPLGLAAGPDLFAFALNQPHSVSDPDGLAPKVDYNSFANKLYHSSIIGVKGLDSSFAQFGNEILKLVSNKTALTVVGGAFATWGALHFIGVGQVVDAFLVATLAAVVGPLKVIAAAQFVWAFSKFISKTYTATCYADLEAAGKIFSDGMRNALVGFGSATVINKAIPFIKNFGKYIDDAKALYKDSAAASYIRQATQRRGKTSVPSQGASLIALNSFVDNSGKIIPRFSASSRYSWQEPPGIGVIDSKNLPKWNLAKEKLHVTAMEKFIKETEKPVATWTPQVGNGNGFDYAYLRPNGQLVIVEAKANNGYNGALTAFGGGAKGTRQVEINEQRLRNAVNANRSKLTDSQYDNLITQVNRRSYEVELYVSSRTKLSATKIGVTNKTLGMPIKRVIELPEILP